MQCLEFLEHAERWMEGERPADASAHLEGCSQCRGLVADLDAIRNTAHELEVEVEPPPRMWTSIRAQLESEGVIRAPRPTPTWAERLADFFPLQPRPALAAAYVALLVVFAALLSFQGGSRLESTVVLPLAQGVSASVRSPQVAETTVATLHTHDPEVLRSYRDSLNTVDNVIHECEKMVREDPQNELAREYLYGAYQQKAELLAAITERGALGE